MTGKIRLAAAALAAAAAVAGCSRKPAPAPAPAPAAPNADSIAAARAREDSIARAEAARRDSAARAQAEADRLRAERESAGANLRNTLQNAIFFEFDSDALGADARSALDAKLPILNANTGVRIRVAGNADERGSDEYNLALGQRRAAAAKRYLTQHGVDAGRIDIVSYGEERPKCQEHTESCWQQNRRDDFEITAGGDNLTVPAP